MITDVKVKKAWVYGTEERHRASDPSPGDLICVYGTLRGRVDGGRGGWNHPLMDDVVSSYHGLLRFDRVRMLLNAHRQVPFVQVTHSPDDHVVVEAYRMPNDTAVLESFMERLDTLEGAPRWYSRTKLLDASGQRYWLYTVESAARVGHGGMQSLRYHPTGDWADTSVELKEVQYV